MSGLAAVSSQARQQDPALARAAGAVAAAVGQAHALADGGLQNVLDDRSLLFQRLLTAEVGNSAVGHEPPIRPVGFWDDCVVRHSFPDYQSLLTFFALLGPARIGPRRVRGPTQLL